MTDTDDLIQRNADFAAKAFTGGLRINPLVIRPSLRALVMTSRERS